MILEALLDTIGLILLAACGRVMMARSANDWMWQRIVETENEEGDSEVIIAILGFFGMLLLVAGIALAIK